MYMLLVFVFLDGRLHDISDEGMFSGEECELIGSQMVFLNKVVDVDGISLKYKCIMGA